MLGPHLPFSSFSSFWGCSRSKALVFRKLVIFAVFVKHPIFGRGQKHGLANTGSSTPRVYCVHSLSVLGPGLYLSEYSCIFPCLDQGIGKTTMPKIMRNGPKSPQWRLLAMNRRLDHPKFMSPCRKRSPAKGLWQKSDERSDRSIRRSDQKVTERVPKTNKKRRSNFFCRTPFAAP